MKRLFKAVFAGVLALVAVAAPARADCDHFKWSVAQERGWFSGSPAPLAAEGGVASVAAAYNVTLARDDSLHFPVAPERTPEADRFGAVVGVSGLDHAGLYQITLSQEAWIDVSQNGARVKSSDFSGQKDCPGVRKTVRFDLAAGPAVIQISNATAQRILLAIAAAP